MNRWHSFDGWRLATPEEDGGPELPPYPSADWSPPEEPARRRGRVAHCPEFHCAAVHSAAGLGCRRARNHEGPHFGSFNDGSAPADHLTWEDAP